MRIFVTGATGYLGGPLSRRLVAAGHTVTALVRGGADPAVRGDLQASGVVLCPGDVVDRASMREGMAGSDWVIHAAAVVDPDVPAERMQAVNVQGSENVASLAYKLGVGRFLSVSSVAWFGGSPADGSLANEDSAPLRPFPTLYSATKHAGEEAIRAHARRGLKVSSVHPGLIYGPPGRRGGANSLLRGLLRGRYPVMTGGRRKLSWIHLDDVVDGILRVMQAAPPGRSFLLAGEVATMRDVASRVSAAAGVPAPRFDLPPGAARVLLAAATPFLRAVGRRPPFSAQQLGSLTRHWAFDDARARRELAWQPRSLEVGLPPTLDYLSA